MYRNFQVIWCFLIIITIRRPCPSYSRHPCSLFRSHTRFALSMCFLLSDILRPAAFTGEGGRLVIRWLAWWKRSHGPPSLICLCTFISDNCFHKCFNLWWNSWFLIFNLSLCICILNSVFWMNLLLILWVQTLDIYMIKDNYIRL